jgi:ferric-dicitrate binding protein FerR (iron transport regulator)
MKNNNLNPQAMAEIAKYLSGELEGLQKSRFEEQLLADPQLNKEFLETRAIWNQMDCVMAGEIDTHKAWEKVMGKIEMEKTPQQKPYFRTFIPMLLRVAAAVVLISGLAWLAMRNQQQNLLVYENVTEEMTSVKALDDGSMVYLAKQSNITVPQKFGNKNRIVEMQGEAFFDVAHDQSKPFIVKTATAVIQVLGTSFNVKSTDAHNFELFVETGKVKVSFRNDRSGSVTVEPGQLLSFSNGSYNVIAAPYYNTQWRKNLLHFKDEKLGDIFYALSKTYGIEFKTSDQNLKNRMMTLTVYDSSVKTISELISLSLGIEYEIKNDSLVIFRSRQ